MGFDRFRGLQLAVCVVSIQALAAAPTVVVVDVVPAEEQVTQAHAARVNAVYRSKLEAGFKVLSGSEVEQRRAGPAEAGPELGPIKARIAEGKSQFLNFQFAAAIKTFKGTKASLQAIQADLRDYQPLLESLQYLAVSSMNSGDKKSADAAFRELAHIRPDYQIDPKQFPPNVLQAFEKVRAAEAKTPRGRLSIKSEPSGASVFLNEFEVGVTPLVVPAPPGAHMVRVQQPGYFPWNQRVQITSYQKEEVAVLLKPKGDSGPDPLAALEANLPKSSTPRELMRLGAAAASAIGVKGVVVSVLGRSDEGFVLSSAYLPSAGYGFVRSVVLGSDFADLPSASAQLAQALSQSVSRTAGTGPLQIDAREVTRARSRPMEFDKYALGFAPGGYFPAVAPDAPVVATKGPSTTTLQPTSDVDVVKPPEVVESRSGSILTRWWFWTGVAIVAAGAGGTAYYLATQNRPVEPTVRLELARQ